MIELLKRFGRDQSGATATVVNSLSSQLKTTFTKISSQLAAGGQIGPYTPVRADVSGRWARGRRCWSPVAE
jgi:Flp pilus assembly pilin Flp